MHCKQADVAILKILLYGFNSETWLVGWLVGVGIFAAFTKLKWDKCTWFYHKTDLCGNYVHLARHGLCRIYALLSRIRFCREYALFWVYFVQTFTQTSRILLRFCADVCTQNWPLTSLIAVVVVVVGTAPVMAIPQWWKFDTFAKNARNM